MALEVIAFFCYLMDLSVLSALFFLLPLTIQNFSKISVKSQFTFPHFQAKIQLQIQTGMSDSNDQRSGWS